MRKRTILIAFAVFAFLFTFGCEKKDNNAAASVAKAEQGTRKKDEPKNEFSNSVDSMAKIAFGNNIDRIEKTVGENTIYLYQDGYKKYFFVAKSDSSNPYLIYAFDSSAVGTTEHLEDTLIKILTEEKYIDLVDDDEISIEDNGTNVSVIRCYMQDSEYNNFQLDLDIHDGQDFIPYMGSDNIENLINAGKIGELQNNVENYISEENPRTYDSVWKMKDIIDSLTTYWGSVEVKYDDFAKKSKIYYKGITDINEDYHLVPYTTTESSSMSFLIGFYASDWLFFDKIEISKGGDYIHIPVSRTMKLEDVMPDATVFERIDNPSLISKEDIDTLSTDSGSVIRFSNSTDGSVIDFNLSNNEINALKTINSISEKYVELSNTVFRYNTY
jgi:hypothetical protein